MIGVKHACHDLGKLRFSGGLFNYLIGRGRYDGQNSVHQLLLIDYVQL